MRVESPLVSRPQVESNKVLENKEIRGIRPGGFEALEDSQSLTISAFGSSRTYSISSLKAAADYHAKFLTVAGNNLEAANHSATIPRALIERLGRQ